MTTRRTTLGMIATALTCCFALAVTAFPQSAKEAYLGLKKLEAQCQSGISYRDYSGAVAEAKFPVNTYMQRGDSAKYPELTDSINAAMRHYEFVNTLWQEKMSRYATEAMRDGMIYQKGPYGPLIARQYPETRTTKFLWATYYVFDSALPVIWAEASKELQNTARIVAKMEEVKADDIDKLKKENEQLKAETEAERLKIENENLRRQLELMKSKREK